MFEPKKIACEDCMHRSVCKHKDDLRKAQAAVDEAKVSLGSEKGEIAIRNMSFIMPVVLGCKHKRYDSNSGVVIRSIE